MQNKIILIIGGPGTGKTTTINALLAKGYCCYPEISRQVTIHAKEKGIDQLFVSNPLLFSELLLNGRRKQYDEAQLENAEFVFLDRGIPDVVAYLDFVNEAYPEEFIKYCECARYDKVFVFPPWESIFVTDNERYESFDQASQIHQHLVHTYNKFGYQLVEVPHGTVNDRISFILENLKNPI